jgi:hypothetical protein
VPCLARASSRKASHTRSPSLYEIACAGHPRYRSISERLNASSFDDLAGVPRPVLRNLLLAVHADVDHHASGAERLRIEESEAVLGACKEPEFVHQPLGVQRPALAMAAHEFVTLESREFLAIHDRHTNLQVVARNALVVCGGRLAPQRESRATVRRVPGATGPREILARWHVILCGRAARRRNLGVDRADADRNVKVALADEEFHRFVHQVLQPLPQVLLALDGLLRLVVEEVAHLVERSSRFDLSRARANLCVESLYLI